MLPQRPYLPAGSLRRVVSYPDAADSRGAGEIAAALHKVDLGHLAARLDEDAPWDRLLSGGEKQRLAFARIFLMRPDIVVLDEATAALDLPSQDRLMKRLMRELADATIVSVGHRPELAAFHHRTVTLAPGAFGATLASDVRHRPEGGPRGASTRLSTQRRRSLPVAAAALAATERRVRASRFAGIKPCREARSGRQRRASDPERDVPGKVRERSVQDAGTSTPGSRQSPEVGAQRRMSVLSLGSTVSAASLTDTHLTWRCRLSGHCLFCRSTLSA